MFSNVVSDKRNNPSVPDEFITIFLKEQRMKG